MVSRMINWIAFWKRTSSPILGRDLSRIFDNIHTCPIRNFQLVDELDDSRRLLKEYDSSDKFEYWDIYNEMKIGVMGKIGLSNESLSIFYLEKNLLKLESEYYATDNEALLTFIEIKKNQLKGIRQNNDERPVVEVNADSHRELSRWLKYDSKTLSVYEYFHNIKVANAEAERLRFGNLKTA